MRILKMKDVKYTDSSEEDFDDPWFEYGDAAPIESSRIKDSSNIDDAADSSDTDDDSLEMADPEDAKFYQELRKTIKESKQKAEQEASEALEKELEAKGIPLRFYAGPPRVSQTQVETNPPRDRITEFQKSLEAERAKREAALKFTRDAAALQNKSPESPVEKAPIANSDQQQILPIDITTASSDAEIAEKPIQISENLVNIQAVTVEPDIANTEEEQVLPTDITLAAFSNDDDEIETQPISTSKKSSMELLWAVQYRSSIAKLDPTKSWEQKKSSYDKNMKTHNDSSEISDTHRTSSASQPAQKSSASEFFSKRYQGSQGSNAYLASTSKMKTVDPAVSSEAGFKIPKKS